VVVGEGEPVERATLRRVADDETLYDDVLR
jgi:hypothetical protein